MLREHGLQAATLTREKGAMAAQDYLGQKPEQNFNVSRDF